MPNGKLTRIPKKDCREALARMCGRRCARASAVSLVIAFSLSPGQASPLLSFASLPTCGNESQGKEVTTQKLAAELKEAASMIAAREFSEAESLLKRILEEDPQEAEALMLLGVIRAERSDNA
jgi:hypothetical protein